MADAPRLLTDAEAKFLRAAIAAGAHGPEDSLMLQLLDTVDAARAALRGAIADHIAIAHGPHWQEPDHNACAKVAKWRDALGEPAGQDGG